MKKYSSDLIVTFYESFETLSPSENSHQLQLL